MKKIIVMALAALLLVCAMTVAASAAVDDVAVAAPAVEYVPAIDGVKDDVYDQSTPLTVGEEGGDVYGKAYFAYDYEALYVFIEVKDSTVPAEASGNITPALHTDSAFVVINLLNKPVTNNCWNKNSAGKDNYWGATYGAMRTAANNSQVFEGGHAHLNYGAQMVSVSDAEGYVAEFKIIFGVDTYGEAFNVETFIETGISVEFAVTDIGTGMAADRSNTPVYYVSNGADAIQGVVHNGFNSGESVRMNELQFAEGEFSEERKEVAPVTTTPAVTTAPPPAAGSDRVDIVAVAAPATDYIPAIEGIKDDVYDASTPIVIGSEGDDIYGKAYFAYDNEFLYVFMEVKDSTIPAPASGNITPASHTDSAFVVISMENKPISNNCWSPAQAGKDNYWGGTYGGMRMSENNPYVAEGGHRHLNSGFVSVSRGETDGYVVEMKIPFGADLNGKAYDVASIFENGLSIEFAIADAEAGSEALNTYNPVWYVSSGAATVRDVIHYPYDSTEEIRMNKLEFTPGEIKEGREEVTTTEATTPAITTPTIVVPVVTTPAISTPAVTTPTVTTPTVTTPAVTTPEATTPAATTPAETTAPVEPAPSEGGAPVVLIVVIAVVAVAIIAVAVILILKKKGKKA